MANYRCNTCRGEFTSPTSTGGGYFHSCPPLTIQELKPLIGANIFFCAGIKVAFLDIDIPRVGTRTIISTGFVNTMVQVAEYSVERVGRRDENIVVDPATRQKTVRFIGTGVSRL